MKEKPFCNQILTGVMTDGPGDNKKKKCFEQNTDIPPPSVLTAEFLRELHWLQLSLIYNNEVPVCLFS